MRTTIDAAGRLVIPKKLRDQAGLTPGMELDITFRDGRIEVEPACGQVTLVERDGFLVAVARTGTPRLSAEFIQQMIDEDRESRDQLHREN
jgi:AbrB family looped-hinge helix DNA binding protein